MFRKILKTKLDQNTHQIAPLKKKKSLGEYAPNPPSKSHAQHVARDMQISKFEKKILAPPPKSWLYTLLILCTN